MTNGKKESTGKKHEITRSSSLPLKKTDTIPGKQLRRIQTHREVNGNRDMIFCQNRGRLPLKS